MIWTESKFILFLKLGEIPSRPTDIPSLMKQFCVSSFSYAPLRRFLTGYIGKIPMRENIAQSLCGVFDNIDFLYDSNWLTESLYNLAEKIQLSNNYNLFSKEFKPRIIAGLLTGTAKLKLELANGLDPFFNKISSVTSPSEMWKFVNDFSSPIINVGPALISDFLKEIGFTQYVKVDHHLSNEFPKLMLSPKSCSLNQKQIFISSIENAKSIGITPFHLDKIFYLWGRNGK